MLKVRALIVFLLYTASLPAQVDWFAGGYVGISTLSGDARTDVNASGARFSSYKPENGPGAAVFLGRHLTEFFSVMGSYAWNRNAVALAAGEAGAPAGAVSQDYRSHMHTLLGEGMLYFRPRRSRIRPYLSAGVGGARVSATARGAAVGFGAAAPMLPREIAQTRPAFRVAVGIDLFLTRRTSFRYSFSETLQRNPFSAALTPPAPRNLANFQNWFGAAFYF
ncbi:MAG TPA: hypothetical protein DEH78_30605 [Solibacterales bacterium]|nr:hypothetical protein [Bryobacterales bacterium]